MRHNALVPSAIFGDPADWPPHDMIGLSGEFSTTVVVEAYRTGVFPMPVDAERWPQLDAEVAFAWFSPMRRGILPLDGLRVTRSLRKMARRYRVTRDRAFDEVMRRCGDPSREGAWINDDIRRVYGGLHDRGLAHSVEVWDGENRLVGGLYGVGIGGLFAGESMFHDPDHGRDASKVALVELVSVLTASAGQRLLDVQWCTPHLATLGVIEIDRSDYLTRLSAVLTTPAPDWRAPGHH